MSIEAIMIKKYCNKQGNHDILSRMRARVMKAENDFGSKNIFNKIISDHWEEFKKKHPIYNRPQYNDPIVKALKCGMEEGGYIFITVDMKGDYYRCLCGQDINV
jgi:hypothetical protein